MCMLWKTYTSLWSLFHVCTSIPSRVISKNVSNISNGNFCEKAIFHCIQCFRSHPFTFNLPRPLFFKWSVLGSFNRKVKFSHFFTCHWLFIHRKGTGNVSTLPLWCLIANCCHYSSGAWLLIGGTIYFYLFCLQSDKHSTHKADNVATQLISPH